MSIRDIMAIIGLTAGLTAPTMAMDWLPEQEEPQESATTTTSLPVPEIWIVDDDDKSIELNTGRWCQPMGTFIVCY